MFSRTNFPKKNSFSRSGLALLVSSMVLVSACGPVSDRTVPVSNGAFPQQIVDSNGNTVPVSVQDLSAIQAADWNALRGSYAGSLHHYGTAQGYTLSLSEKTLQGRRFAYAELRSSGGELGTFGVGAYLSSETIYSAGGATIVRFMSGEIPGEMLSNWVGDPVVLVMELTAVTSANGSKVFDPTHSTIYILDCAVSLGNGSCSNVYPHEIAGFLSLGKR